MHDNWNNELKMLSIVILLMLLISQQVVSSEEIANDGGVDVKDASSNSNIPENSQQNGQGTHGLVKRAWNQLQSAGWGKRSFDDVTDENAVEDLQRKIWKLYADQLMAQYNQAHANDELNDVTDDYDSPVQKRKWNQMNAAWGKRDWNNMRGLWGKRAQSWNKLSSAWGK